MVRLALLSLALVATPVMADPITGPVTKIRDGDTFLVNRQPIRLCGVDAPERKTNAGKKATAFITQAIKGKTVRCIPVGEGTVCDGRSRPTNHDRIVAQCFIQGRDIAEILVRSGHACDWPKFSGGAYRVVGGCSR